MEFMLEYRVSEGLGYVRFVVLLIHYLACLLTVNLGAWESLAAARDVVDLLLDIP